MWNEILNRLDENKTPAAAASLWDADQNSLQKINHGINLVYRFKRHQQGYYLRLTHETLRSVAELNAALAYLNHLFVANVPVCEPIPSQRGAWIEKIQQEQDCFLAQVCREVPGKAIDFDSKNLVLYRRWGEVLAQLHQAASYYHPKAHCYTSWQDSLQELEAYIDKESLVIQQVFAEVKLFFTHKPIAKHNYGLTHGDHREANVLTDGRHIHIIDFDLPSFNWFMEDVCRPFFHPIVYDEVNWQDKIRPYLEGYFSVMPKNSLDMDSLSKQIQLKCLEIYLWTKNNWNSDIAPGGNKTNLWLERVHEKLVNTSWIAKLPTF
ncbi:phosphotransferase enzyme family protein [Legionella oakridgensis]|uniref:Homoserine kinase n=2 Tax=Legionella oakridgensis TaxID=29423 RepID=A0A0W0XD80_9GAMM|nr:phosphotransferase [Legionella oakridgensis]AHE68095.1 putative homoserine kinase type II [Legionella oakridgensis ATCC 33761 = DSM 21215]KTD42553.1 homoserine kinase [Legionella oakridgensis]STY21073.1 Protein kinase-like [Legionella longbeachae]